MKKLIIIVLVSIGFFFTGCEKESITGTPSYSDVTWYASNGLNVTTATVTPPPTEIVAGKALSVYDLSQGALTHEWKISTGASFLLPGFKNASPVGTVNDLTAFIDPSKGLTTTDYTVFILFPTAGDYTVTLRDTFKEKVTYKGSVPVEAVLIDGVWVFEQTFKIKVI
ncbi:hypothetical protein FFWV33_17920 [Flavobacterium faecale]|uniref:PKD domain-containing protein n=1 Tax=Flavobacterium faecale TaxID=1355330 RepID=A0A2S1LHK1_9FLAO|nr:hypothetical protein [Flavobacterium faecale]AWG23270.1 hypothetical protein FFWV33_17920 [Flavobacterium faecale]